MTYTPPRRRDQNATLISDPYRRLEQTLAWRHGVDRAAAIIDGTDHDTNADLAKWRALGRKAVA